MYDEYGSLFRIVPTLDKLLPETLQDLTVIVEGKGVWKTDRSLLEDPFVAGLADMTVVDSLSRSEFRSTTSCLPLTMEPTQSGGKITKTRTRTGSSRRRTMPNRWAALVTLKMIFLPCSRKRWLPLRRPRHAHQVIQIRTGQVHHLPAPSFNKHRCSKMHYSARPKS